MIVFDLTNTGKIEEVKASEDANASNSALKGAIQVSFKCK